MNQHKEVQKLKKWKIEVEKALKDIQRRREKTLYLYNLEKQSRRKTKEVQLRTLLDYETRELQKTQRELQNISSKISAVEVQNQRYEKARWYGLLALLLIIISFTGIFLLRSDQDFKIQETSQPILEESLSWIDSVFAFLNKFSSENNLLTGAAVGLPEQDITEEMNEDLGDDETDEIHEIVSAGQGNQELQGSIDTNDLGIAQNPLNPETRQGMIAWGANTSQSPEYKIWNGTGLEAVQNASFIGGGVEWVRLKSNPKRNQYVLVTADAGDDINIQFNSTITDVLGNVVSSWNNGSNEGVLELNATSSPVNRLKADVAVEQLSGDVLVVYSNNLATPGYRTFNGSEWSPKEQNVTNTRLVGGALAAVTSFVKMASKPDSDEIALIFTNTTKMNILIWNGSDWTCELNYDLPGEDIFLTPEVYQHADLAYEQNSKDLFIVNTVNGRQQLNITTKQNGTCAYVTQPTTMTLEHEMLSIGEQYGSDYIMVGAMDIGLNDAEAIVWNGSEIINKSVAETSLYAEISPNKLVAPVWAGRSSDGLFVYSDAAVSLSLDYFQYNNTFNTWEDGGAAGLHTGTLFTDEEEQIIAYSFIDENKAIAFFRDEVDDFWGKIYNASDHTWHNITTPNHGENIHGGIAAAEFPSFDFTWRLFTGSKPMVLSLTLNSTNSSSNRTDTNLTAFVVTSDDRNIVKVIYNWLVDTIPIAVLNMPFEGINNTATNNAWDYSGYQNPGNETGSIVWNASAGYDGFGAYQFDGVDDYLNLGNRESFNYSMCIDGCTFGAWIYPRSFGTAPEVIQRDGLGNFGEFARLALNSLGNPRMIINENGSSNSAGCTAASSTNVNANQWMYVVGRYNVTHTSIFINGTQNGATACSFSSINSTTWSNPGRLLIGTYITTFFFNGTIDEVMIWNRSISAEQIFALWQNKTNTTVAQETTTGENWTVEVTPNDGFEDGDMAISSIIILNAKPTLNITLAATDLSNDSDTNLTAYTTAVDTAGDTVKVIYNWLRNDTPIAIFNMPFERINGTSTNNTRDYSGLGYDASSERNNPAWISAGYDGKGAYDFNDSQYLNSTNFEWPTGGPVTVVFWIKAGSQTTGTSAFGAGEGLNDPNRFQAHLPWTDNNLYWDYGSTAGGGRISTSFAAYLDKWTHVALVSEGNGGSFKAIYLDGVEVASANVSDGPDTSISRFLIGAWRHSTGTHYLDGMLDEFIIFNRSLSAEQIFAIFQNQSNVIVGQETLAGENWSVEATPNDGFEDGDLNTSNEVSITPTVECGTLNTDRTLSKDLTSATTCVTIAAHNIVLNCAGFNIFYDTGGSSTSDQPNVGVRIDGFDNVTVKNCRFQDTNSAGTNGYGIYATSALNLTLTSNTILTNGTTNNYGIYFVGVNDSKAVSNNASTYGTSSSNSGMVLGGSLRNNLSQNIIVTNGSTGDNYGIYITDGTNHTTIDKNNISAQGGTGSSYGIFLFQAENQTITYNIIYNSDFGSNGNNYGMLILDARNDDIAYNQIFTNGSNDNHGIALADSASENISFNHILANKSASFGIDLLDSNHTTIHANNISARGISGTRGVNFQGRSKNNSILYNNIEAFGTNNNFGISLTGKVENNSIAYNNILTNGSTTKNYGAYLTAVSSFNNISFNTIETNGTADNHGVVLEIAANNSLIQGNNITARGSSSQNFGVYIRTNVSKNNIITNNNIVTYGTSETHGVVLSHTARNNTIVYNNISTNGTVGGGFGIYADNGTLSTNISFNTIFTNGSDGGVGIIIEAGSNNTIIHANNVTTRGTGVSNYGIFTGSYINSLGSIKNTSIMNNEVSTFGGSSSNIGISIGSSRNSTVAYNRISTGGAEDDNDGISLTIGSAYNNVSFNNILTNGTNSGNSGINIDTGSNHSVVHANTISTRATSSLNEGISLTSVENSSVLNNDIATFGTSGNIGIDLVFATNNLIAHNNISTNGTTTANYGVRLFTAGYNNISFNVIFTNGTDNNHGIYLVDGSNHSVFHNNIISARGSGTRNHGIFVHSFATHKPNTNNTFVNNTVNATSSGSYGIGIEKSFNNTFLVTNITAAGDYGVNISNSNGTRFENLDLNNLQFWIKSGPLTSNNFTNTSFITQNGSIKLFFVDNLGEIIVNSTVLNITSNLAFINSSKVSALNTSALITLRATSTTESIVNPTIKVDYEDDGIFKKCDSMVCQSVSSSGGTFVFNVTRFTSYSIGSRPTMDSIKVNSSDQLTNNTDTNLTAYANYSDLDGDDVKVIYNWLRNNSPIAILNSPFEGGSNDTFTLNYARFINGTTGLVNGTVVQINGYPLWNATGGHDGKGAYVFDGASTASEHIRYGTIATNPRFNTTNLTVVAWFRPNATLAGQQRAYMRRGHGGNDYLLIGPWATLWYNGSAGKQITYASAIPINEWSFQAFVVNTTNISYYYNGLLNQTFASDITPGVLLSSSAVDVGGSRNSGSDTLSGTLSDILIYDRQLSGEQIYALFQNKTNTTVGQELTAGENWSVEATPNDGIEDGQTNTSNNVTILEAAVANNVPIITALVLNTTNISSNRTEVNLTALVTTSDADGDSVKVIYNWLVNATSIAILNMPFEGINGTTINNTWDYSGLQNHGSEQAGVLWNATGGYDGKGAHHFDGTEDGIRISTIGSLPTYTISAWLRPDVFGNFRTFLKAVSSGTYFALNGSGVCTFITSWQCTNATLEIDKWVHVAVVSNGDVYVNGLYNGTIPTETISGATGLDIGNRDGGPDWDGTIDEFMIFNRTLSSEQIYAIFQNQTTIIVNNETRAGENWSVEATPNDGFEDGTTTTSNNVTILNTRAVISSLTLNTTDITTNDTSVNLTALVTTSDADSDSVKVIYNWIRNATHLAVLNMPFEGINGTATNNTLDYSGFENDGKENGTASTLFWNSTGGYDSKGAYEFNDTGVFKTYINISYTDSMKLLNASSVSLWVRPKDVGAGTRLLLNYCGNGYTNGYMLAQGGAAVNLYWRSAGILRQASNVLTANTWNHVAFTNDGTNIILYVNGVNYTPATPGGAITTNCDTFIGGQNVQNWQFNGTIDEVMIFNRSLSSVQIKALFNNRTDLISSNDTVKGENWSVEGTPNDGMEDGVMVTSNNITILNTIPSPPILVYPGAANTTTIRTPTFIWNNSIDADLESNISYRLEIDDNIGFTNPEVNVSGITNTTFENTTYALSTELNVDTTYWWRVFAYDQEVYSVNTSPINFTVQSFLAINVTNNLVDFGSFSNGQNVSTPDNATAFRAENVGNILSNITVTGTPIFNAVSFPSTFYQFKIRGNETAAFNTTYAANWTEMNTTYARPHVVDLDWHSISNDFLTDINLVVPLNESAGTKTSAVTFTVVG